MKPNITLDEIERLKEAVAKGIVLARMHLQDFQLKIQRMTYGKELRMAIASSIEEFFPGSLQLINGTSTYFQLPSSFNFFVCAEQDFRRTARCKDEVFCPNLFSDDEFGQEESDGKYELVLSYSNMQLSDIYLIPHDPLYEVVCIWSETMTIPEESVATENTEIKIKNNKNEKEAK